MLYVCCDNNAYMNAGIQRSSATPFGAATATPAGSAIPRKMQSRKNMAKILAARDIPCVDQASPRHYKDVMQKVQKAAAIKGPKFLNVLSPCNRGWRSKLDNAVALARLAVDTCFWPLFEPRNAWMRETVQQQVDRQWHDLLRDQDIVMEARPDAQTNRYS